MKLFYKGFFFFFFFSCSLMAGAQVWFQAHTRHIFQGLFVVMLSEWITIRFIVQGWMSDFPSTAGSFSWRELTEAPIMCSLVQTVALVQTLRHRNLLRMLAWRKLMKRGEKKVFKWHLKYWVFHSFYKLFCEKEGRRSHNKFTCKNGVIIYGYKIR